MKLNLRVVRLVLKIVYNVHNNSVLFVKMDFSDQ